MVELFAQALAVEALGGRRHPQHPGLGKGAKNDAPLAGDRVMGLVDNEKIMSITVMLKPAPKRLHRGDDDRVAGDARALDRDQAVADPCTLELGGGLPDQLAPMDEDADALALLYRHARDVREDDGLAGAGWRLQQNAAVTLEGVAGLVDQPLLVGAERKVHRLLLPGQSQ